MTVLGEYRKSERKASITTKTILSKIFPLTGLKFGTDPFLLVCFDNIYPFKKNTIPTRPSKVKKAVFKS